MRVKDDQPIIGVAYLCPKCAKEHLDREEAISCCALHVSVRYQCLYCGHIFSELEDARVIQAKVDSLKLVRAKLYGNDL